MRHLRSVPPPGSRPGASGAMPLTRDELSSLLTRTGGTCALVITLLDEPLAADVSLAYLLFRLARILEEAREWGRDARIAALDSFGEWLIGDDAERLWLSTVADAPPAADEGCLALLARADAVKRALTARGKDVSLPVAMEVVRAAASLAELVTRQTEDGGLVLEDLRALEEHCASLAGPIAELLTELFIMRDPALEDARDRLMDLAAPSAEALFLVSLVAAAPNDAEKGRVFVPRGFANTVTASAGEGLARAEEYVVALEDAGASDEVLAFCKLALRLGRVTLERSERGAERLSRAEVIAMLAEAAPRRRPTAD
ncbi:MAG: Squalene synthase [Labilithrix sp.]|nr:Squalene synthase [Labilithrix sp.]